jgi:hypothetical protein
MLSTTLLSLVRKWDIKIFWAGLILCLIELNKSYL